eukprot:11154485-Lingulodinium_polyedra.AAC.1
MQTCGARHHGGLAIWQRARRGGVSGDAASHRRKTKRSGFYATTRLPDGRLAVDIGSAGTLPKDKC